MTSPPHRRAGQAGLGGGGSRSGTGTGWAGGSDGIGGKGGPGTTSTIFSPRRGGTRREPLDNPNLLPALFSLPSRRSRCPPGAKGPQPSTESPATPGGVRPGGFGILRSAGTADGDEHPSCHPLAAAPGPAALPEG